ncbi:MAG: hypothetical protein GY868_02835, partial [Deltaproteobacteria bacterium]|nr:hypothetical protein [Deltaproteobacteria bacterium]
MKKVFCTAGLFLFVAVSVVMYSAVRAEAVVTTYNCAALADVRLDQRDNAINFGDGTTLKLVGDSAGAEVVRSIIRFNVPPFISAAQVQSATLHLYARKS